jgi:hypothetical protein
VGSHWTTFPKVSVGKTLKPFAPSSSSSSTNSFLQFLLA